MHIYVCTNREASPKINLLEKEIFINRLDKTTTTTRLRVVELIFLEMFIVPQSFVCYPG